MNYLLTYLLYCLYLHFHAFLKKNKPDLRIEISYLLTFFNFDGTANKTSNPAYIPYLDMLSFEASKRQQWCKKKNVTKYIFKKKVKTNHLIMIEAIPILFVFT
jgi:hypothetical protein